VLKEQQQNVHVNKNLLNMYKLMFPWIVVFHHHVNYFVLHDQHYVEYLLPKNNYYNFTFTITSSNAQESFR